VRERNNNNDNNNFIKNATDRAIENFFLWSGNFKNLLINVRKKANEMGNCSVYYAYALDGQRCVFRRVDSSLMFSSNKPPQGKEVLIRQG
jgi:hypothetical protein